MVARARAVARAKSRIQWALDAQAAQLEASLTCLRTFAPTVQRGNTRDLVLLNASSAKTVMRPTRWVWDA